MSITKNSVEVGTFYTSDSFLELKSLQLDLKSKLGAESLVPNEPSLIFSNRECKYQLFTLERALANHITSPIQYFSIERLTHNQYYIVLMVNHDWLVEQENNIDSELYAVMDECLIEFIPNFQYSQIKVSAYEPSLKQLIHNLYKFKLLNCDLYEKMLQELETLTKEPINITSSNPTLNIPRKLYLFNAEYNFKELLNICSKTLGLTEPMKEFNSGKFYNYGLKLNIAEFAYIKRFLLNSYLSININL